MRIQDSRTKAGFVQDLIVTKCKKFDHLCVTMKKSSG